MFLMFTMSIGAVITELTVHVGKNIGSVVPSGAGFGSK